MKRIYIPKKVIFLFLLFTLVACGIQKRRHHPGFYVPGLKQWGKSNEKTREKEEVYIPQEEFANSEETIIIEEELTNDKIIFEEKPTKTTSTQHDQTRKSSTNTKQKKPVMHTDNKPKQTTMKKNENKSPQVKNPRRRTALMIGISLVLMALIAGFAATTIGQIFVVGNAMQTSLNLATNWGGFVFAIAGWVIIFILDVLVAVGVLKYYKKERSKLAWLSSVLRFIYTAILGGAILQLFLVNTALEATKTYSLLASFNSIWGWGLIIFGLHLITLGVLYENENGKKWLTITIKALLILAGIGYLIQYIGILIVANPIAFAATIEAIFIPAMILGEIGFAIWMLVMGGKAK